jgi:hypothetical protein
MRSQVRPGEELGRLLPDLAWSGQAAAGAAVPGARQGWLFERLLGVVQQLAATAPLLLIVEDLHWADRSTATCSPRRPTDCPGEGGADDRVVHDFRAYSPVARSVHPATWMVASMARISS